MRAKLARPRGAAKSSAVPKGKRNFPEGKQISPVMRKVRGSLAPLKAAAELRFLTGQPLSICQKTLSGHRIENRDMLAALFTTRLAASAVLGLIPKDVRDPTARKLRKFAAKLNLQLELDRLDREMDE